MSITSNRGILRSTLFVLALLFTSYHMSIRATQAQSPSSATSVAIKNFSETRSYSVRVIDITSPATARTIVAFSDKDRNVIPLEPVPTTAGETTTIRYEIDEQSLQQYVKLWVRVTSIDFDNKFFDDQTTEIKFEDAPTPTPTPTPIPVPTPSTYDGPNEFGLGQLSFDSAPIEPLLWDEVAIAYKQAGDFLFGIPEVKVIYLDPSQPQGTEYELLVWLKRVMEDIVNRSSSPAVGKQWFDWYVTVMNRTVALQRAGTIQTTQHWFSAFDEIRNGVMQKND